MKSQMNIPQYSRRQFKIVLISFVFVVLASYLIIDYRGPSHIQLKPDNYFNLNCLIAKDIIVQEFDIDGTLWATRGMIVYKKAREENSFEKVTHIPTGFSIFWLRNFSIVRKYTVRPECVEMATNDYGDILALSAGTYWFLPENERKFIKTMEINHYGFGNQGVRNVGLVSTRRNDFYYGEYFQNSENASVMVYQFNSLSRSWKTLFEFPSGQIRHVHAIQEDPYTDKIWICTGDSDDQSSITWTDNNFEGVETLGNGSQLWRSCQLVFTEQSVLWGTDTYSEDVSGIYCWDRRKDSLSKLIDIEGAIFYGTRLAQGTVVFSSNREGLPNETDDRTRMYIVRPDRQITVIDCGTWNHKEPGFRFKYAKLRFQRNQGSPQLAISCLNQKEIPDGDLILISEETLIDATINNDRHNSSIHDSY